VSRNRQSVPREQRVDELVGAATELMLTRGYTATRMSEIARAAGVANAALYWYFPTKDHLLAEVMDRAIDAELDRLAARPPSPDPFQQLLRGLTDLRPYRLLHMAMHDRLDVDVVAATHDRLIGWIRGMARAGLAYHGVADARADDVADLVVLLVEGLNVPGVPTRTAAEALQTLMTVVLDAQAAGRAEIVTPSADASPSSRARRG
jgi:AcrR family transcriptional regulator